jgi:APA family basic amino acid/polyamine antiporter
LANQDQGSAPQDELRRGFGLSTATYVVIASMVGTGILVSPGYMMVTLKNYPVIFGLWALGGLLALCGALCVAELAAALPRAGGEYVYLREAYGPMPAFLSGWTSFLVGFSAPLAVTGYVAAKYLLTPFGLPEDETAPFVETTATAVVVTAPYIKIAAAAIIVIITLPNLLGHRQSAWTQNLTTALKFGLFVVLVVLAFLFGKGSMAHTTQGQPIEKIKLADAATQLFYVMFAYTGWNAASYLAGEVKNAGKILPRSLLLGTGLVIVLYLALNLVFAYAVPLADVGFDNATQVPTIAVENLFGPRASSVFSVLLGLTFLATVSAFIITGPRIYYAMAKDGLFPAAAGSVSSKGGIPVYAMIAQSVCAIVVLFAMKNFRDLYQYAAVGLSVFAMLFIAAVYVLRWRKPEMVRPFRVPGYPVVPAIYIGVILFMTIYAFKQWRTPSFWSLGSILAGVPVYYIWSAISRRMKRTST